MQAEGRGREGETEEREGRAGVCVVGGEEAMVMVVMAMAAIVKMEAAGIGAGGDALP